MARQCPRHPTQHFALANCKVVLLTGSSARLLNNAMDCSTVGSLRGHSWVRSMRAHIGTMENIEFNIKSLADPIFGVMRFAVLEIRRAQEDASLWKMLLGGRIRSFRRCLVYCSMRVLRCSSSSFALGESSKGWMMVSFSIARRRYPSVSMASLPWSV